MVNRWENGSGFHWMDFEQVVNASPWDESGIFLRYGRDVLGLLIRHGRAFRGWQRLWVPSYYCPEVVQYIIDTGIEVILYSNRMLDSAPAVRLDGVQNGDAIVVVNYFGLGMTNLLLPDQYQQCEIIEDHSHDPWSFAAWNSNAAWCFASLRKVLPIPDGAILWSPQGHSITESRSLLVEQPLPALKKLSAMLLKRLYLEGEAIDKEGYWKLSKCGESDIATEAIVAITAVAKDIITTFPVGSWREQRKANYELLVRLLRHCRQLSVMPQQPQGQGGCPFSAVLILETPERRNSLCAYLVSQAIYPAILWQVDRITAVSPSDDNLAFSQRMLSLHCDGRYSSSDMVKVATVVRNFFESSQSA